MKNLSQERKRKKNAPMEYEDFAADILLTAKGTEKDAMAKAGASMLKGSTNAGRTAEMLAAKGLLESGYEDYMRSRVKLNAEKAVSNATESRLLSESRARGGYEEYISEYDKLQTKLGESVIKQLSTEKGIQYMNDETKMIVSEETLCKKGTQSIKLQNWV